MSHLEHLPSTDYKICCMTLGQADSTESCLFLPDGGTRHPPASSRFLAVKCTPNTGVALVRNTLRTAYVAEWSFLSCPEPEDHSLKLASAPPA